MKKNSIYDLNYLWMMFVLLHIVGASAIGLVGGLPGGNILFFIALEVILYYSSKGWKYAIIYHGIQLTLILIVNNLLGDYFRPSYMLNLVMITFVIYTVTSRGMGLKEYFHIKLPAITDIILCLLLAACTLPMAMYINSLSMCFTTNHVTASLQMASGDILSGILTLAILPAVVEECMFRGCIYKAAQSKKAGLIVSAACFALLHTNLNQMSYALFMGLVLGVVIMMTDNILLTVMMHIFFNMYSIIMNAFSDSVVIQRLMTMSINGYHLFNPNYTTENMKSEILSGFIVFLICGFFSAIFFYMIRKQKEKNKDQLEIKTPAAKWYPDYRFIASTLVCIIVAIIYR